MPFDELPGLPDPHALGPTAGAARAAIAARRVPPADGCGNVGRDPAADPLEPEDEPGLADRQRATVGADREARRCGHRVDYRRRARFADLPFHFLEFAERQGAPASAPARADDEGRGIRSGPRPEGLVVLVGDEQALPGAAFQREALGAAVDPAVPGLRAALPDERRVGSAGHAAASGIGKEVDPDRPDAGLLVLVGPALVELEAEVLEGALGEARGDREAIEAFARRRGGGRRDQAEQQQGAEREPLDERESSSDRGEDRSAERKRAPIKGPLVSEGRTTREFEVAGSSVLEL